ncbi:tetratricopeptide repeat protein [bacterium]|nr:tetratricopeptide repeat protein [bacterium]
MKKKTFLIFFVLVLISSLYAQEYFNEPEKLTKYDKSHDDLQIQKLSEPNNANIYYSLSEFYLSDGRYKDAISELKRANQLKPNFPFILCKLGDAYYKMGKNDSAKVWWERALEKNYEYIDVWEKLVRIAPEYYFNLGVLYKEKAEERNVKSLAERAINYFDMYISKLPDGFMINEVKSAKKDTEFLIKSFDSDKRKQERERVQDELRAQKKQDELAEMEYFRTNRKRIAGLGFKTFNPTADIAFDLDSGEECLTDSIALKSLTNSFTEWMFSGGIINGPFIFRGAIMMGSSSVKQMQFPRDTIETRDTSWVDNLEVKSVSVFQMEGEALYNFYYINPIMIYAAGMVDFGYMSLTESDDLYGNVTLYGIGAGLGLMLKLENWLIDFEYKRGLLGSSRGGMIVLCGYYKF